MATTSLVPTLGAVLIGDFISCVLYGANSMQAYYYFYKFWNTDGWRLKALVTFVWFAVFVLQTAHISLICVPMFQGLILDVGDPTSLERSDVSAAVSIFITALIIFTVHCFYVRRLWLLSNKNWILVSIVMFVATCALGFEIVVLVGTLTHPDYTKWHHFKLYIINAVALSVAGDIIIAVAMVYLLQSRKTNVKSTNGLVTRIITYLITTGLITSIMDILAFVCFVTMPNNLVYVAIYNCICNLYTNSLLTILNARDSLKAFRPGVNLSNSLQLSELNYNTPAGQSNRNLTKATWMTVEDTSMMVKTV